MEAIKLTRPASEQQRACRAKTAPIPDETNFTDRLSDDLILLVLWLLGPAALLVAVPAVCKKLASNCPQPTTVDLPVEPRRKVLPRYQVPKYLRPYSNSL